MGRLQLLAVVASLPILACTSQHQQDPLLSPNPQIITEAEIINSRANTAYDVIRKVHANFLTYRGAVSLRDTTMAMPFIFVDDLAYGPFSTLRSISANQISEIRLYRAWEAVLKFGTGLPGGAIAIRTRLDN